MNELNDVWFWAKVAGLCTAMLDCIDENGKVWLSEDDKDMLKVLSEIGPREALKLADRRENGNVYHVTVYTTGGGFRRLYFPSHAAAMDWAMMQREEMDDVDEVWMCEINPNRTESYGSCMIEENQRIL